MTIQELKQELGIKDKDIAGFIGLTPISYANSSAKKRYEKALCSFYAFVKGKREGEKNNKITSTDLD